MRNVVFPQTSEPQASGLGKEAGKRKKLQTLSCPESGWPMPLPPSPGWSSWSRMMLSDREAGKAAESETLVPASPPRDREIPSSQRPR